MLAQLFRLIEQLGLCNYVGATLSSFVAFSNCSLWYCATSFVVLSNYFRSIEQLLSYCFATTAPWGRLPLLTLNLEDLAELQGNLKITSPLNHEQHRNLGKITATYLHLGTS